MNRRPGIEVIRKLRSEVGFGCPVHGCGNPYLEWHHFDPPWHVENHHNPNGMIALCTGHHKKADGGAYTNSQLQEFKNNYAQAEKVKGSFDWLRNELLVCYGGNIAYKTLRVLNIQDRDVVWFNRDEEGYLRLNVSMLSILPEERVIIEDNIWTNIGTPKDLSSPPQGKELNIHYHNGDHLHLKFLVLKTPEEAYKQYKLETLLDTKCFKYPLTAVDLKYKIGGTSLELNSNITKVGSNTGSGIVTINCGIGIKLGIDNLVTRENPSLLPYLPESRVEKCPCGSGVRYKYCHGLLT